MDSGRENKSRIEENQIIIAEKEEAFSYALKVCSSSVLPMTISTAVEMGLFKLISEAGPGAKLSAEDVASRLDATSSLAPAMLERLLSFLASHSVLTCSTSTDNDGHTIRRYGATPACQYFIPDENGGSLASFALFLGSQVIIESWYHLKEAILDGGTAFSRAHQGLTAFQYFAANPKTGDSFNDSMRSSSILFLKNILSMYDGFKDVNLLVDVGGGTGGALSFITTKHPHIRGINFDLPHVISQAPPLPRVEHVGGDVFESIPGGDALFLKHVLHDWDDEACLKILKNCWKALPSDGKVVVVEFLLPEIPECNNSAHAVFSADVITMAMTPNGRERTEKDFRRLAQQSGFSSFNAAFNFSLTWLMEFGK